MALIFLTLNIIYIIFLHLNCIVNYNKSLIFKKASGVSTLNKWMNYKDTKSHLIKILLNQKFQFSHKKKPKTVKRFGKLMQSIS